MNIDSLHNARNRKPVLSQVRAWTSTRPQCWGHGILVYNVRVTDVQHWCLKWWQGFCFFHILMCPIEIDEWQYEASFAIDYHSFSGRFREQRGACPIKNKELFLNIWSLITTVKLILHTYELTPYWKSLKVGTTKFNTCAFKIIFSSLLFKILQRNYSTCWNEYNSRCTEFW